MVNAALRRYRRAAAGNLFSKSRNCRQDSQPFALPFFLHAYQRDLNFSPAQPALSNASASGCKVGTVFEGMERESPAKLLGARGMIGIDQTGRRTLCAIAAAIAIASAMMASGIIASTASFAVPRYDGLWSVSS